MLRTQDEEIFSAFTTLKIILILLWTTFLSIPELLFNSTRILFPHKEKDLKNKIVLITGTGRGLGKQLAFEFASHGSQVICVDIDQNSNEETCRELIKQTGQSNIAVAYTCNVGSSEEVDDLKNSVLLRFGHVDIIVNNAGIVYGKTVLEEEEKMIKKVVDVNQMSNYWMIRAFLPHMKERNGGHIVFINSIASLTALGDAVTYTVTKSALLGLSMALADEFSRDVECTNIKISSAHPYFISTDGLKSNPMAVNIPAMTAQTAAKHIVTGIRREYSHFTVPGYELGYYSLCFARFLPFPIYHRMSQLLRNRILNQTDENVVRTQ